MAVSDREYFFARIEKQDGEKGCWIWMLKPSYDGYGVACRRGRRKRAHRLSWELFRGKIPKGMLVCHSCDTPRCVNPSHLFIGSYKNNSDDMWKKGRGRRARGEKHPNAKLSEKQVLEIRESCVKGSREFGTRALARKYGVANDSIHCIVNGKTWRHLDD